MSGTPTRRCRRCRGTPTRPSSSSLVNTVAAVATAAVAVVVPLFHRDPVAVCAYNTAQCFALPTPSASRSRRFGHDAGVSLHNIGSRSDSTSFSGHWEDRSSGDIAGGGTGSLRFIRRRRSYVVNMMGFYNPNDELRAIVQRKQHEIKAFLKQHTAEDDRLQV